MIRLGIAIATLTSTTIALLQNHRINNRKLTNYQQTLRAEAPCVVWHSQHKSGGFSIERTLQEKYKDSDGNHVKPFICDENTRDPTEWRCDVQECLHNVRVNSTYRVAIRGYTPTLASRPEWSRDSCIYATMSREPVARLVSAYMYCRSDHPGDPLCGYKRLKVKNVTLEEFAKHWGNFLFRELLLFPEFQQLAKSRKDFLELSSSQNCAEDKMYSPWLQWKDQLNGGDDPETESGWKNLQAVLKSLNEGTSPYHVHGMLEEWNKSMVMFDAVMPLNGMKWLDATKSFGDGATHLSQTSESYKSAELQMLAEARNNQVIRRLLAADLALYAVISLKFYSHNFADDWALRTPEMQGPAPGCVMIGTESTHHCEFGYYRGNCGYGVPSDEDIAACASLEACKAQCLKEENCKFLAYKPNVCSRYDDRAGDCSIGESTDFELWSKGCQT